MSSQTRENQHVLIATMKHAAAALRDAEIEFMLGGGLAAWARGGPPTDHDVDFYVREEDAERALEALAAAGMRIERPPEEWLFKAYDGPVLVDLIFRPAGGPIGDEHFARATQMEVGALTLLVASIDDVLVTKLLAISEQEPNFQPVIELARALREQIDWEAVRSRTGDSPVRARVLHARGRTRHRRVRKLPSQHDDPCREVPAKPRSRSSRSDPSRESSRFGRRRFSRFSGSPSSSGWS